MDYPFLKLFMDVMEVVFLIALLLVGGILASCVESDGHVNGPPPDGDKPSPPPPPPPKIRQ